MATFNSTYGPMAMMASVAEHLKAVELDEEYDIHTVTLVLNGQHGEFDLTVEATDQDLEDHKWTGIAYRYGGVLDFEKQEV